MLFLNDEEGLDAVFFRSGLRASDRARVTFFCHNHECTIYCRKMACLPNDCMVSGRTAATCAHNQSSAVFERKWWNQQLQHVCDPLDVLRMIVRMDLDSSCTPSSPPLPRRLSCA